jgi:hypothetical protein
LGCSAQPEHIGDIGPSLASAANTPGRKVEIYRLLKATVVREKGGSIQAMIEVWVWGWTSLESLKGMGSWYVIFVCLAP